MSGPGPTVRPRVNATSGYVGARFASLLLVPAALAILLAPLRSPFNLYDEGLAVLNGARVLQGELPYRDFWTIYPPGQSIALAALFKTFGASLLISRLYDLSAGLLIVLAVWSTARKLASSARAGLAAVVVALLIAAGRLHGSAVLPSLGLGLLGVRLALEYWSDGRRRWLLAAGVLLGASSSFRWDIGLYAVASVVLASLLHSHRTPAETESRVRARLWFSEWVSIGGPLAVVVLACYGPELFSGSGSEMWDQVVNFPAMRLRELRWKPLPSPLPTFLLGIGALSSKDLAADLLGWLQFYFPVAVYGVAWWRQRIRQAPPVSSEAVAAVGMLMVTLFGTLLLALTVSRYDDKHVLPASVIAALTAVTLLPPSRRTGLNGPARAEATLLVAGTLAVFVLPTARQLLLTLVHTPPWATHSRLDRGSGVELAKGQEEAVEFLRSRAAPEEPIFVGNSRHDLVFVNDVGFYFLAARRSATRYSELHPGVATTLPVQRAIVGELEDRRVRWVVLVDMPVPHEPNASAVSTGVSFLDDHLRRHYESVARFGDYRVLQRADARDADSVDRTRSSVQPATIIR